MKGLLISVGLDVAIEATAALHSFGEVGKIADGLYTLRAGPAISAVMDALKQKLPGTSNIVVVEVNDSVYKGDGSVAYALSLLRN